MRNFIYYFFILILYALGCKSAKPVGNFKDKQVSKAPDYSQKSAWSVLPSTKDVGDLLPNQRMTLADSASNIDVFYLYPTTYTGRRKSETLWNADLYDEGLNEFTDSRAVKMQATIFNGAGRMFVPRYRQAHLESFYTKNRKEDANAALDLAYQDVKAAFTYYMEHENRGRGIIIAGHSQGARHGKKLLKELFDEKPLQKQLVAAYLIGWPIEKDFFNSIEVCTAPDQTGCFCSWRTWERKFGLRKGAQPNIAVTNPLSWNTAEDVFVPRTENKGAVLLKFSRIEPEAADAQIHKGYLLSKRPKFRGSFFIRAKNYHVGDLNLYYMNVRENAELRAKTYEENLYGHQ